MKITNVRTMIVQIGDKNCIFVFIDTDEGITGISETVCKRRSKTIEACINELKPYLLGKDPTKIEDHFEKMYRDSFWVGGPLHATPISAIEIALWDILGKSLNTPIYKLMGGPTRDKVPVYCHCASGASPEELAENAKKCVQQGHIAIKIGLPLFYGASKAVKLSQHPSTYYGTNGVIDRSHKETELLPADIFHRIREFFIAAREAVGPKVHLMLDCHGRFSPANALLLIEKLVDLNLLFIEEPVPPENPQALRQVCSNSPIPIAAGERWSTIYEARKFLHTDTVAIAQPDVVSCGGLIQAKKIAAIAEAEYIPLAPHNPNGPLATLAALHLAATIPNFLILETIGSQEDRDEQACIVKPNLKFENGYLLLPEGPGLGGELDLQQCKKRPYKVFEGWR